MRSFNFEPIGVIRSCFTDKFGIPRQSGLVPSARGRILLCPPYDREEAFQGLDGFSHLWVIFVFHDCADAGWRPTVRPPRLGGRAKVGVFASRAPYRPNPIGISAVRYAGLGRDDDGLAVRLEGIDLLDGTPVLDIKPYIPYADSHAEADPAFASKPSGRGWEIAFSDDAERQLHEADPDGSRHLRQLIVEVLEQDPRPGYMDRYPDRTDFCMRLYDVEIRWRLRGSTARVVSIEPAGQTSPRPAPGAANGRGCGD